MQHVRVECQIEGGKCWGVGFAAVEVFFHCSLVFFYPFISPMYYEMEERN